MIIAEVEIFKLFLLVMTRFSGLMVSAPFLGSGNFPIMARAGFTAAAAAVITPALPMLGQALPDQGMAFAIMALGEFLIGLILGFVMLLVFAAVQVGGQIMDLQTGFGMMNVFNPALETQFPVFGFFLFIVAVLYLLALNGHHVMIEALVNTYDHIPVGGFTVHPELLIEVNRWGAEMFVDGLLIAAPVATAMLLAYVTMGLLGRVIPQIHLFIVGFPITMATGLFLTAMIIGIYLKMLDGMFYRMFDNVNTAIHGMAGG